ncbi:unnamed protein product [Spirodela intermedia]|uniref:Protein SCAR n=1 Tax=Spirodela intermedia TaxID=51605 RepID=A0A7I8IAH2_SPIIN|nr:unnamed protein product [Spirodela intermedia]CAA6654675.1 unnamed protein product [Spirodela intermedia]
MPVVRYQIRNEYGLADPALYGAADKEDPEALLEGVAMAGLVGVLRQLGDLAEFAAEIFHDLHEEVMATSSRGHGLLLRVQQLETEFPAIEKGFFNQTDQSDFYHSAAIDWHPNLQIDQNMVTREDIPRFILDSYEESRGPPRLFMLDKFDSAEDGACLKRYSDPSFFKTNFASTGNMEADCQRERKSRKNKKKIPRWRNGITSEAHTPPLVDQKLEHLTVEKVSENQQVKRVRLKARKLNDNLNIGRRYKESILDPRSPERAVLCKNSASDPKEKTKAVDSIEFSPEVREIIIDVSNERPNFRERNTLKPPNKEVLSPTPKEKTLSPIDRRDGQTVNNEKKEMLEEANGRVENLLSTLHEQDRNALLVNNDFKREVSSYAESKSSSSLNDYRTDDVASELENYLDALTTMESEIETDNETRIRLEQNTFIKEYPKFSSIQERKQITENLEMNTSDKPIISSVNDSLFNKGVSGHANEKSSFNFSESLPSLPVMFVDQVSPADECHETTSINNLSKSEVLEEVVGNESPRDLVQDQMTPNAPGNMTGSSCSCTTDSATGLDPTPEDIKSATVNLNTFSSSTKSNEMIDICFDYEYNPQLNSDIREFNINVMPSDLVEEHEQNGRLAKGDSLPRSGDPKIPVGGDKYLAHDKNTEILVDSPCDKSDLNLEIHDGPLQTLNSDPSIDESKAERIITGTNSEDTHKVTDVESAPSIHVEDSLLDLSVVANQEEQLRSVPQEHKVDSGESTPSPRTYLSIFPLDDRSSTGSTEGLFETKESSVSSSEKFEHARSSTCSEVADDFSDNDDTSPENQYNFTENGVTASDILSPSSSHDQKLPQDSFVLDQVESAPNGELPDTQKVFTNLFKSESIHLNNIHSERGQSLEQDNDSARVESGRSFPELSQDSFEGIGSSKIFDSERTVSDASGFNQRHAEAQSPRQPGFGFLASSKVSDNFLLPYNTVIQHESSELPLEEDPPPPPLPPIQWRMGKLRPNASPSMRGMAGPPCSPNQLSLSPSLDHSWSSPLMGGTTLQPLNPFLDVRITPSGRNQVVNDTLEESTSPFHSSVAASRVEDVKQKIEVHQEALSREISESSVALPFELSDAKSQQLPIISVGESMRPSKPSIVPVSIAPEPRHEAIVYPSNTFLPPASTEVERTSKDRMVEGYFSDTPSTAAVPQSVMGSQWIRMYTSEDEAFPADEYQKPFRRPHSLLNRPRDPLIEAVASHDKSTLRKVSELVHTSAKPEGERNVLLEQIRSKSFNLKPAAVAKPSMKGPPTNLKVAAILEKANAIRQAVAGSDEDDDGDSWSDS